MSRPAVAAVLLLLLPAPAFADGGSPLPGVRTIWIDYILTVDRDYPDYEFYLATSFDQMPGACPRRLPLTPSTPVRLAGDDLQCAWAQLFAVKKSLDQSSDVRPSLDWLRANEDRRVVCVKLPDDWSPSDCIRVNGSLPFTDNRERIVITCRLEIGPDGWRLVQVSENEGNPWIWRAWVAVGVLLAVGFVVLGFRWVRRIFWRRSDPQPPVQGPSPFDPNYSP